MFSFTNILLIATLVVIVSSKNRKPQIPEITENPYIIGDDVKGAKQLAADERETGFNTKQSLIALDFEYPSKTSPKTDETITKIAVVITAIDDDVTYDVNILDGGLGQKHVRFQVVSENTSILGCRVNIYGIKK